MPITGLIVPVSGPYTATWNSQLMGAQNDDGFALLATFQGQEVNASDVAGMTLVEAIFRGINWRMRFRGLEFNRSGILSALQAFGSSGQATTTLTPTLGAIGSRYSEAAQALVLTAILLNPPTMPQTLTALGAIPAPQSNVEYLMTSKVREAPMEMVLLPYVSSGSAFVDAIAFTTT